MASSLFGGTPPRQNPTSASTRRTADNIDDGILQKIGAFIGFMKGKDPEAELQKFIQQNGVTEEEYENARRQAEKYAPLLEMFLASRK